MISAIGLLYLCHFGVNSRDLETPFLFYLKINLDLAKFYFLRRSLSCGLTPTKPHTISGLRSLSDLNDVTNERPISFFMHPMSSNGQLRHWDQGPPFHLLMPPNITNTDCLPITFSYTQLTPFSLLTKSQFCP